MTAGYAGGKDAGDAGPVAVSKARSSSLPVWLARRLLRLVVLLVAVAIGGFLLVESSPIDPVDAYIGADMLQVGAEQRALIEQRWGLDDPAATRFFRWAGQVLQGNLGTSMTYNRPVADVIGTRFVASLGLMAVAWLLSGVIGFALGIAAGSRPGSLVDRAVRWWAYTLASAPTFWVGLLLLSVFAVSLGWAPACCAVPIGADPSQVGLIDRLHHLALPAITLSLVGVGPIALHTREQAASFLGGDSAIFARAQGERAGGMVRHHLLRNAAVPALTLQFASLSELFGGAVLAEQVFSYPGLGQATVAAGLGSDVPLLLGITLVTTVFVFVGNLLGDVAQSVADPRVRLVERRGRVAGGSARPDPAPPVVSP